MNSILLFGPRVNKKTPTKIGGTIVLFEDLLRQLENNNINYSVIDTNKENYKNKVFALISIYVQFLRAFLKYPHISIHGTAKDYIFIAPFVIFFAKLFHKKISIRKFAGNFDNFYKSSSHIGKKVIEFVLKNSHFNFFETKYLVQYFKKFNNYTFWFPNVREKQMIESSKTFNKKFVFISQLYKSKGVDEIFEASNMLSDEYIIDLYGPLKDKKYTKEYFKRYKANYKGSLQHYKVLQILKQYDVLILVSYYPGEGYPGIIIEALSVGKPVIVTDLESIKEMLTVDSAVFVSPKNANIVKQAILKFRQDNYEQYSKNALVAFEKFDSQIQTNSFLKRIEC